MWLREIEADRLRNLKAVALRLPAGLTVVTGRNGQGKSSLLEAIYLAATSRSFRTRKHRELVAWDGGPLRVAADVSGKTGDVRLTVIHHEGERSLMVDGVDRELQDYLGRLHLVDLTGPRMDVLRGAPDERRRFLDRGVAGLRPTFLSALFEYRKVLVHRNALLRRLGAFPGADTTELDAWDDRFVTAAATIHRERRRYALDLATRLGPAARMLFPDGDDVVLRYRPSPAAAAERDPEAYEEVLREKLVQGRARDLGVGFSQSGPHRDDLVVTLGTIDLRKFGSAGQLRAAMVILKLAKLDRLAEETGEAPVFVMDDFDTDLDETRLAALAAHLHERGIQSIVATSKEKLVARLEVPFHTVRMVEGEIRSD